jgi:predicted Rossmann fold nucleotide-binding protein DprA/Smf involved in DNA uptake
MSGFLLDLSMEKAIQNRHYRHALDEGNLTLLSPYVPDAGFSAGAAMGRNKLIYTLADYGLVVACEAHKGGTWRGSTEVLRRGWVPVFVVDGPDASEGNKLLLNKGTIPLKMPFPSYIDFVNG